MKKLILVLAIVFMSSIALSQDAPIVMIEKNTGGGIPFAYEALTIDDTAGGVPLTVATYTSGVRKAFISLETAEIRFRIDGGAPTNLIGHLLQPGQTLVLSGYEQVTRFRGIRTVGSGAIKVTYLQ